MVCFFVLFLSSSQKHELLLRASVNCLSSLLGFLQRKSHITGITADSGQMCECWFISAGSCMKERERNCVFEIMRVLALASVVDLCLTLFYPHRSSISAVVVVAVGKVSVVSQS